jgi:hypothetical protein
LSSINDLRLLVQRQPRQRLSSPRRSAGRRVWHCEPGGRVSDLSALSARRFSCLSTASGCWHCQHSGGPGTTSPPSARSGVSPPSNHRRD